MLIYCNIMNKPYLSWFIQRRLKMKATHLSFIESFSNNWMLFYSKFILFSNL